MKRYFKIQGSGLFFVGPPQGLSRLLVTNNRITVCEGLSKGHLALVTKK